MILRKHFIPYLPLALIVYIVVSVNPMSMNAQHHKKLKKIAEKHGIVGMSVLLVQKAKITDVFHYGLSDIRRNKKVDDHTMFRIASISKTFTTVALMKLYENGHFKLDDDIGQYLGYDVRNPYYPELPITFRMLLNHTSGLRDSELYDEFLMKTYRNNPPPFIKDLLSEKSGDINKSLWLDKKPGCYFNYCNLNFGIIGTLIEKISGNRFDIFLRNNVLTPLGILGSFNISDIKNINDVSPLYRNSEASMDNFQGKPPVQRDLSNYTPGDNGLVFGPQGSLRISAVDLAKFMLMLMNKGEYNGKKLMDSSTDSLLFQSSWKFDGTNGETNQGQFKEWGLGFQILDEVIKSKTDDFMQYRMIGHSGDAYGLISSFFFNENMGTGFIFICNGYKGKDGFASINNSPFYLPEKEVFELVFSY